MSADDSNRADDCNSVTELLAQARAGDQAALGRLFDMCRHYVTIMARTHVETRLQSKVDASDLVQQTLLEAYRGFDRFQGASEGEWLAWLKRILANNAADFIRHYRGTGKRAVNRECSPADLVGDSLNASLFHPADPGESPSQHLVMKERELQLADALAQLTPDHREVIILRNLQRLPFDEVAARMERTRPAVQMLWMRAIQKLQEKLKE